MMSVVLTDMLFKYDAKTAETLGPADIVITDNDAAADLTLENSVLISIGTNARAADTDILPDSTVQRGGYWGSVLLGFELGSKLWLLDREKLTDSTAVLVKQYTEECLNWLLLDGVASEVNVTSVRNGDRQISTTVVIIRPDKSNVYFTYSARWDYQLAG